jgi:hypothetical protein
MENSSIATYNVEENPKKTRQRKSSFHFLRGLGRKKTDFCQTTTS